MRSETRIQLVAAIVAVAALLCCGFLAPAMSAEAGRAQLGYAERAEESDPPEVAVGIALGAFRGLFVNLLWLRAAYMKEEGKFYESMELARTITRLQPRFPRVWAFQAWNMAYNISVATRTPEERWMWVSAGVDLLREEGIPKNPSDTVLHKELAWIFNHKIQGYADDANLYYKRRLAEEWTIALGPPPPRGATTEETTDRYLFWLNRIAEAPSTMEELIRQTPAVETLVRRIRDEAKLEPDVNLLRAFEYHMALRESPLAREGIIALNPDTANEPLMRLLVDDELFDAWIALIPHLRKRRLLDHYHMEPTRMIQYTRRYGPLDWRHPSSHALYWAVKGVEAGLTRVNVDDLDRTNTDRVVLQAIQELARWGEVYYDLLGDSYVALPNPDFFDTYGKVLETELRLRATNLESADRPFTQFSAGYENFMRDVIRYYFRLGDIATAQAYYRRLREFPYFNINDDVTLRESLSKPLEQFVRDDVADRIGSPQVAIQEFDGACQNAFLRGLLRGNRQVFEANVEYAKWVHGEYMQQQLRRTNTSGEQERMELLPREFEVAAGNSLVSVINSRMLSLEQSAIMYRRAPLWLQQAAYDRLASAISGPGQAVPADVFPRLFPEPPNMAQYRQAREAIRATDDRSRKDDLNIVPN